MMSTCCSKHVETWNKYIKKECVKLVINQNYVEMHGQQNIKVTCIFENLKVVLMWYERCACNVNELVDTSCVAVCIGSESVLPAGWHQLRCCLYWKWAFCHVSTSCSWQVQMCGFCNVEYVGTARVWPVREYGVWGCWSVMPPPPLLLSHVLHTRFAADGFLFYLVTVCCAKC
jgi:hypothetical protein